MISAEEYRIVWVTVDSYEQARQIARVMLSERIATSCNILPGVTSLAMWNDDITEVQELLLLIKTSVQMLPNVESRIKELHAYDIPEIISVSMNQVNERYMQWMQESLQ